MPTTVRLAQPAPEAEAPIAPARVRKPLIGDDRALARFAFILGGVLMVWRLYVACISHVIWEEAHFIVSGQHLGLAYPDIPGGFAWLARIITTIFGWHVLPLRLVSLAITTAIPWAVWFMATPVVSRRNAIWAAIAVMMIPTSTMNGTVYYPEGALQLLLALMCGCLVRAFAAPQIMKWWLRAGVIAMAGILVHYRFLVPGLAAIAYLLINPQGRKLWRNPGIYIVGGLGFLGLLPSLVYNATHDWPAIQFHVINRAKYDLDIGHIVAFVETQWAITTPMFFLALCWAAKPALVDDRNRPGTLLGYQSAGIFLFYSIQAIVNRKIMPHWPFMAYVPLMAYLPGVVISFADRATNPISRILRLTWISTGPIMAVLLGIAVTAYQILFDYSPQLPYKWRQFNIFKNEDWSLLEPDLHGADARARQRFGPNVVWASSGHISAVRLEFPAQGKPRDLYTLDEPYDVLTSRFVVARHDWGLDRAALMRDHAGQGVVLALDEPSYRLNDPKQVAFSQALCQSFDDIEPYKIVTLPPGRTAVDLFTARVRPAPLAALPKAPCPLVPALDIAYPTRGTFASAHVGRVYSGMAADPIGIKQVDVLLDHRFIVTAHYGLNQSTVVTPDLLRYDPNWPNLQYTFVFPKGSLKLGQHDLSIRATRSDGTTVESDSRLFYVK